jgi:membrane-associated protease RseP (regulator of RpoE activity)
MDLKNKHENTTKDTPDPQDELVARLRKAVGDVFAIEDVTYGQSLRQPGRGRRGRPQILRLRGRLMLQAKEAFKIVTPRFKALEHTLLLRREDGRDAIYAVPGIVRPTSSNRWLNVVLFVLTVISVLFTSATAVGYEGETLSGLVTYGLTHLHLGLPAAAALLVPLLAHEFGHYLTARHFGLPATLPYFVPLPYPLSPLGTMGAIIRMKGPMLNRKTLLAVGAAGPLAGLIVALPFLIWGLSLSPITDFDPVTGLGIPEMGTMLEGNSILYAGIKYLMFGQFLPGGGKDVLLDPVAFSAWAALLVTGINLIPAGQLDGGHIAYALLGDKARWVTRAMLGLTLIMGFFWQGWWLWALLIWFFGQQHAAPLDDITPLTARQQLLAAGVLLVFVLTFIPIPLRLILPPGV